MFREMRRKAQQVSREECISILQLEKRAAFSVIGDDGYPYTVPVNYYYDAEDGRIYFHCAKEGHKHDAIRSCDKVCFTVWHEDGIEPGSWWYHVTSVVAFGRAELLIDNKLKEEKLRKFGMKYFPEIQMLDEEMAQSAQRADVVAITIEHMTGKHIREK